MHRPLVIRLLVILCGLATVRSAYADDGVGFQGKDLSKHDFKGKSLEKANFQDAKLVWADFTKVDLVGANFRGADLTNATLRGADLTGADFTGATVLAASFQDANLTKATLKGLNFKDGGLGGAILRGADLRDTKWINDLRKVDLRDADLRGANLLAAEYLGIDGLRLEGAKYDRTTAFPKSVDVAASGAVLDGPESPHPGNPHDLFATRGWGPDWHGKDVTKHDFKGDNLEGANFQDAKAIWADFTEVRLRMASFKGADLTNARLGGADLTGADFRGALVEGVFVQGAILQKANLDGISFKGASAYGVDFRGASLRNAKGLGDIRHADFRGADLTGANLLATEPMGYDGVRLEGARYDTKTLWPKGLDPVAGGAKLEVAPPDVPGKAQVPGKDEGKTDPAAPVGDNPKPQTVDLKGDLTEAVMKQILSGKFSQYEAKENVTVVYESFTVAASREGDHWADGTPVNTKTIVTPVRVKSKRVTLLYGEKTEVASEMDFVFFKDEFGEWTERYKGQR